MRSRLPDWLLSGRVAQCFFLLGIALCVISKFWLIQNEETFAGVGVYDDLWFVEAARVCYWDTTYSWAAFVRPPGYPLFVALLHWLGISLRFGIESFQIAGYAFLIYALRRAGLPRTGCLAVFAMAIFHPCSFQLNNYALADPFYAGALVIFTAAMILTLVRGRVASFIVVGVSGAVLWITREETMLLFVLLITWAVLLIIRKSPHVSKLLWAAMPLTLLVSAIYFANYATFGSFANSEITSSSFRSAQRALTRIKPPQVIQRVLVTREALKTAYSVSPTFAQLQPTFDGLIAGAVAGDGLNGEIRGSWFRFALVIATNKAGFHRSPQAAREFYKNVAREINQACAEHRIPTRRVYFDFFDPGILQFLDQIPGSFLRVCSGFTRTYSMSVGHEDPQLQPQQRQLFDTMTFRRATSANEIPNHRSLAVENWIGRGYSKLVYLLTILAIIGTILSLVNDQCAFLRNPLLAASIILLVAVAGRVALFTYFDYYTDGSEPRFIFPVMALWSTFSIVMTYGGAQAVRRLISANALSRAS